MATPTRALAEFSSELEFSKIPESVVRKTKMCFLDWLGSAMIGSSKKPAHLLLEIIHKIGGTPESSIIADVRKTSCVNAALVNGAMSHIVELDDVHEASILHPGASIIPAAMSMAEREQADGRRFLLALVAGYDAAIRIGEAVNPSHYKYWHTTGTCGTFGAAVAAGTILDLEADGMLNALGNAGTQAAGLWEFAHDGSMSKHLHPGKASANGVLSALLAQKGFTGASTILEGSRGFCEAMSDSYDLSRVTEGLGQRFKISEVSFKPHASCRHTHSVIDAIINIQGQAEIHPETVKTIRVRTYSVATQIAGNREPRNPFEAKFSLPYCASVALVKGRAGLGAFDDQSLNDPMIRNLMKKVELRVDPELDRQHPKKWPAEVQIETNDGQSYSAYVEFPLGSPQNPIKDAHLRGKFEELASTAGFQRVSSISECILALEQVSDIRDLAELLSTEKPAVDR